MKKNDLQILEKKVINYQNALKALQEQKAPFVFSGDGGGYDDNSDYVVISRINAKKRQK